MHRADKIVDLETKLGFLERHVEELNEVVVGQARDLEHLQAAVKRLEGRLAGQGDPGQAPADPDERPPHY